MENTQYLENLQTEVKAMLKPFDDEREKLQSQKDEAQARMAKISPESTKLEDLKALSSAANDLIIIDQALENLNLLTRQAVKNFGLKAKLDRQTVFYLGDNFEEKTAKAIEDFVKKIKSIEKEAKKEVSDFNEVLRPVCRYLGEIVADYELNPIKSDWSDEAEEREYRNGKLNVSTTFDKRKVVRELSKALTPMVWETN